MNNAINEAADIVAGTYGQGGRALTITYRRMMYTWTVTVYQGTYRVEELCGAYDNAKAAWAECRRIALAAHQGTHVDDIIAAKPSELLLAEVKQILDTVPAGEARQVRATLAGAHLAPIADAQRRALQVAAVSGNHTVHVGQTGRPTLKAPARKGFGTLNYQPGRGRRKVIQSLIVNSRGLEEAHTAV
ncbi:hypothetical protein HH310_40830 [Actinoplanes sp. TBRC 11911]|uniref:hypothetical protein n=1 Tax=Actinoplanes sp. TBRC 11911 TaxID=2729386 RepID=UPI00145F3657|nr:hypothetical protein [Actinoplanes sp. TBRC 11911]NMO57503.1 hypothetical protein [Actinoplanes sp. TBRC 11911]